MAYRIRFTQSAEDHFAQLTARQQAIVVNASKVQLENEPLRETRNRKHCVQIRWLLGSYELGFYVFSISGRRGIGFGKHSRDWNQERKQAHYFRQ